MEKNISVEMENGEVTLILVDGVSYTSVADIADLEDRARAQEMIDDLSLPDSESAIHQRFEDEFQKMHSRPSVYAIVLPSIFLVLGAILALIAGITAVQAAQRLQHEIPGSGVVVDTVEHQTKDSDTGDIERSSYPVVQVSLADGEQKTFELNQGSWPPAYRKGDTIHLLYVPGKVEEARTDTSSGIILLWLLPAITGFVGLGFLAAALVIFGFRRKAKASSAEELSPYNPLVS